MGLTLNLNRSRFVAALASLALLLGAGASARAADTVSTVDVAARIALMNTVATRTVTAIGERQTRAIARMTQLDGAGKPDAAILAAARAGARAVEEAAERGRREVRKISLRTVYQLTQKHADPAVIAQVTGARDAALERITSAAVSAKQAIRASADGLTGSTGSTGG